MSPLRRVWRWAVRRAAHAIPLGASLLLARCITLGWRGESGGGAAALEWLVVAVAGLALAVPWFVLTGRRRRTDRGRRAAVGCALLAYAAAGVVSAVTLLRGATAPSPTVVWTALVLVAGLIAVIVVSGTKRWRLGLALVVVVGGLAVGACVGFNARQTTGVEPATLSPDEWPPVAAAGPFREAASEAVLGWRWANADSGPHWREALLLQPPCRVTGHVAVPAEGIVRLFVALTGRDGEAGEPVRVRCTATDRNGRQVAQCSHVLRIGDKNCRSGVWQELTLEIPTAERRDVDLTLEAVAANPDAPTAGLPILAVAAPQAAPAGPNCLIILVDTLRADHLHCYGSPFTASPNIDRLASEGTLFERAVSACSWTVPAVTSLFTGTYVSTHGMARFRMPGRLSLPTLAEQFRAAGARTAAVSANGFIVPAAGFGAGFQEFVFPVEFSIGEERAPRAAWVTDRAVSLLRGLKGERFFLYLHYMDPHHPYEPPPPFAVFGDLPEKRYYGEISYCDHEIGRLLAELGALGRTSDTLVVFIADHGEAFREHRFLYHGNTLHREEVHVPLILRYPGHIPAGRRVRSLVPTIDATATILDLMDLAVPRHVEGESLRPLFRDAPGASDRAAFSELHEREALGPPGNFVSLDTGGHKLILRLDDGRRWLYDTRRDRQERTNVAGQQRDLAASMEQEIRRFLKMRKDVRVPDRLLTPAEEKRLRALGYLAPGRQ